MNKESKTNRSVLDSYQKDPDNADLFEMINEGEVIQFITRENYKKPGQPIFIQDDGKVGFPSINGLKVKIGDTIKGVVHHSQENYFFVEVQEIISSAE